MKIPKHIIDVAFDGVGFYVTGDVTAVKLASENRGHESDLLMHDKIDGSYVGPALVDKSGAAIYESFIVAVPIRNVTPAAMAKFDKVYHLRFVFGPPHLFFTVFMVGVKSAKGKTSNCISKVGPWLWTLAYERIYILNALYIGIVEDVSAVVDMQHQLANRCESITTLRNTDKEDDVLSSYKETKNERAQVEVMMPSQAQVNNFTTTHTLPDAPVDWGVEYDEHYV